MMTDLTICFNKVGSHGVKNKVTQDLISDSCVNLSTTQLSGYWRFKIRDTRPLVINFGKGFGHLNRLFT